MPHPWEAKWTVGARLGKGGQGITHLVTQADDPHVKGVLKQLKNNQNAQARGRMAREVLSLRTLADAGAAVPRVLDHNTERFEDLSLELFVVMDFIPGQTLRERIDGGVLDIDSAIQSTLSLSKTVQIAHGQNVLHRDLKPENIILRNDDPGALVIVDYGLSFNLSDDKLTESGETFRNQFLDLPETNTPSGNRRDPRSDLTAVCAILYFCLTGHVPGQLQDGTGAMPHMRPNYSIRENHKNDERVLRLEEFFSRGFAANIANRFQQVEEIQEILQSLLSTAGPIDESDPVALSKKLSQQIRIHDRRTQIAEFRTHATSLQQFIMKEVQTKYQQKLERFLVTVAPGGNHKFDLPPEMDSVANPLITVTLSVQHHSRQHGRTYALASIAEQCVLLVTDYVLEGQKQGVFMPPQKPSKPIKPEWHEVGRFEKDSQPIHSLVSVTLRDWINAQMNELTKSVI